MEYISTFLKQCQIVGCEIEIIIVWSIMEYIWHAIWTLSLLEFDEMLRKGGYKILHFKV